MSRVDQSRQEAGEGMNQSTKLEKSRSITNRNGKTAVFDLTSAFNTPKNVKNRQDSKLLNTEYATKTSSFFDKSGSLGTFHKKSSRFEQKEVGRLA